MTDFLGYVWHKPPHNKGRKWGVNWYRKGKLGISRLTETGQRADGAKVVSDENVEFRYGKLEPQEKKKDVRDVSYEDLKQKLQKIREDRRNFNRNRKKSTKRKKSKSKSRKKKKKKDPLEALKEMDPDIIKQALGGEDEK